MEANRPEIDRLRAGTEVVLDSLALYQRTNPKELEREKREHARQIADKERQIAEANQELVRLRQERDDMRREMGLPPASAGFWSVTSI